MGQDGAEAAAAADRAVVQVVAFVSSLKKVPPRGHDVRRRATPVAFKLDITGLAIPHFGVMPSCNCLQFSVLVFGCDVRG